MAVSESYPDLKASESFAQLQEELRNTENKIAYSRQFYNDSSDSITAITWYRNKQTASSRRCPALQKAEIFLKVMEARIKDIEVLHWDNRLWGEIPADFGNK